MKKILCFLLAVLCVTVFCSCGKQKKENSKDEGTDISYYAKLGQIPECKYKLKENAEDILNELEKESKNSESSDSGFYTTYEAKEETTIVTESVNYLFATQKKNEGITAIISFGDSFGFKLGTSPEALKKAVKNYCDEPEERPLTEKERSLFSGNDDTVCLQYDFDNSYAVFAFEENGLYATALFNK